MVDEAEQRVARLTEQLRQSVPLWCWAPVVDARQALRGVSFITATGQLRLCGRLRRLTARGKARSVIATAIARELTGFVRAVAREVPAP